MGNKGVIGKILRNKELPVIFRGLEVSRGRLKQAGAAMEPPKTAVRLSLFAKNLAVNRAGCPCGSEALRGQSTPRVPEWQRSGWLSTYESTCTLVTSQKQIPPQRHRDTEKNEAESKRPGAQPVGVTVVRRSAGGEHRLPDGGGVAGQSKGGMVRGIRRFVPGRSGHVSQLWSLRIVHQHGFEFRVENPHSSGPKAGRLNAAPSPVSLFLSIS